MKFRVLLTSVILCAFCAFGQGSMTTEQIYQEAYENFVKRDYTGASASLDKINPVDQKKPDILNLRGAIYKRLGELDNAANAYNDALKINPKDWVPKYNLAEVNFLREQYKASRTFLEQALASMPEADRLQKQDLILYKVYLTYLLQGDDEKAKLLLDSFDINSANPVYYFAQAAWSYKKKDSAKAKTWVDSTEGLYSQDLRNSYSQALVDVGWLEPAAGISGTALTANPAPSATATALVGVASPTPTGQSVADIVPLSSDNATPITVVSNTSTPAATPEVSASSQPDTTTPAATMLDETTEPKKTEFWKILLSVVLVLGAAAVLLINLAKRSRMVPAPVDNTGYAAIAASSDPDVSNLSSHRSEGTGVVQVQESDDLPAPAPIKVMPIHREYPADLEAEISREKETFTTAPTPRITRRVQVPAPAVRKTTPKATTAARPGKVAATPPKSGVATPKRTAPSKAAAKPDTKSSRTDKAPASPVVPLSSSAQKASKSAPVTAPTNQPQAAVKEKSPARSTKVAAKAKPAPAAAKIASPEPTTAQNAPRTVVLNKPAPVIATPSAPVTSSATETAVASRRTRLIPVPTINVPLTDEVRKTRVLVSNIGKIVVPAGTSVPATAGSVETAAPVEKLAATPKKAAPPRKQTSPKAKVESAIKPAKAVSPLITIPEFEEVYAEPQTRTVLRVAPNQPGDSGDDNPPTGA